MPDDSPQRPAPNAEEEKRLREKYGLDQKEDHTLSYSGAGMEVAMIVVVMTAGGWALDKWLGTMPFLLLAGAVVGTFGGLFRLIRQFSR